LSLFYLLFICMRPATAVLPDLSHIARFCQTMRAQIVRIDGERATAQDTWVLRRFSS
jgi:hypothetical protein